MLHQSFEKITIRMITESAGVIRPTFYYHFQDKYEVLEWIIRVQLIGGASLLLEHSLYDEAIKLAFSSIYEDKVFYKKAFEITGQNAFADMMTEQIYLFMLSLLRQRKLRSDLDQKLLTMDRMAKYFSMSFVNTVRLWLSNDSDSLTVDEICKLFTMLLSCSYRDCFEEG